MRTVILVNLNSCVFFCPFKCSKNKKYRDSYFPLFIVKSIVILFLIYTCEYGRGLLEFSIEPIVIYLFMCVRILSRF